MRKLTLIIALLLSYLGTTAGVNINVHYCGGKIKHVSFFDLKQHQECCGSKMRSKDCCKDKTTIIKIEDSHQSSFLLKAPLSSFKIVDYNVPTFTLNFLLNYRILYGVSNFQKPPLLIISSLYLSNRVLLI
jgi:hypothetical protein